MNRALPSIRSRLPLTLSFVLLIGCAAEHAGAADSLKASSERLAALRDQARIHEHGEGVKRDPIKAVHLYCEGARLGDVESQFSLGWMYANGRGLPRDNRMASLFFGIAAAQGHAYAQKMLEFVGPAAADLPDCMRDPTPPVRPGGGLTP